MRRKAFPHIKCEQALYYFYATAENSVLNMVKITEKILRVMDREDETAEEINEWQKQKGSIVVDGITLEPNFYFHNFKVYQLEEVRDIIDFGTARTYGGNKIIIEYDYHMVDQDTN
jgi:riboflavin synthase alpha subunit